jgi:16S rRNA processing protein RimM
MEVFTDFPERIVPGAIYYIGSQQMPLELVSCRPHKHGLLVRFKGYDIREQVAGLRNQLVQVRSDDLPSLPEGDFYLHQLLGLDVVDEEGALLGQVSEILSTGANDVFVVRTAGGSELLLPAIRSVILKMDLEARLIRVHLLPGLLPDSWIG